MSFWEELRDQVKQNKTASDITVKTLAKIPSEKGSQFLAVKPAFYFGQLYTLSLDFIEFVENLFLPSTNPGEELLKGLLYIREVGRRVLSDIKAFVVPLESLVIELDDLYEKEKGENMEASSSEELEEEFEKEEAALREKLRLLFENGGISHLVSQNLSCTISSLYLEFVHFAQNISELAAKEGELEAVLSTVLDIQYGLEWKIRILIEEDVSSEDGLAFSPGLLTWSSLALNELFSLVPAGSGVKEKR